MKTSAERELLDYLVANHPYKDVHTLLPHMEKLVQKVVDERPPPIKCTCGVPRSFADDYGLYTQMAAPLLARQHASDPWTEVRMLACRNCLVMYMHKVNP